MENITLSENLQQIKLYNKKDLRAKLIRTNEALYISTPTGNKILFIGNFGNNLESKVDSSTLATTIAQQLQKWIKSHKEKSFICEYDNLQIYIKAIGTKSSIHFDLSALGDWKPYQISNKKQRLTHVTTIPAEICKQAIKSSYIDKKNAMNVFNYAQLDLINSRLCTCNGKAIGVWSLKKFENPSQEIANIGISTEHLSTGLDLKIEYDHESKLFLINGLESPDWLGKFPRYTDLFSDQEAAAYAQFNPLQLKKEISYISKSCNDYSYKMGFSIEQKQIKMSAIEDSTNTVQGSTICEAEEAEGSLKFAACYKHILPILDLGCNKVYIASESSPLCFTNDQGFIALVMPMKV